MKMIPKFACLLVCLVAAPFAAADRAPARVALEDPAGDVADLGDGGPGKDVVGLSFASTGSSLEVAIELADDVAHYLKDHEAGDLLELHVDTDGNPETGGICFWGSEAGFEYALTIRTCIEFEGGYACTGNPNVPHQGYFSAFKVERQQQGKKWGKDAHSDHSWKSPRVPVEGHEVKVSIPYAELDLKPGSTVRLLAREADGSPRGESYFPVATLTLQ